MLANNINIMTNLSTYYKYGSPFEVTAERISKAFKHTAAALKYPTRKGIPTALVDTHSLQCGGANALTLSGYFNTQIQKMGHWRGATFKEYVRENLSIFSSRMSWDMKQTFQYVNIAGNVCFDITKKIMALNV
jgi:hypothetical protein